MVFSPKKAIDAIRLGGLKGQGMGEGILKESVPEAHTDYIIAVVSEEFGSVISILIICIFLFIALRLTKIIINSNSNFYKLALSGLVSLLIFQTFIHVGVNANLLPTTGMTLPFLSYGGSSLISSGIVAGIILNYTSLGIKLDENKSNIVIATGGTGGHVFPSIGLANCLNDEYKVQIFTDERVLNILDMIKTLKLRKSYLVEFLIKTFFIFLLVF